MENLTAEELKLVDAIKSEVGSMVADKATKSEVESMIAEKAKDIPNFKDSQEYKDLMNSIEKHGNFINELRENKSKREPMISKQKFEKFVADINEKKTGSFTVKSADVMTTANYTSGTHLTTYEVDATIHEAPREQRLIFDLLNKGMTASRNIYWTNRANVDGGSAFIGQGVLKPLMDWEYAEATSVAKKVAVRANFSREMLKDIPVFNQDVNYMLTNDLWEEIDSQLLTSTESSTLIKGLIPVATSYTTTSLDDSVVLPNRADAVRAGMLQMRLLKMKPNVVVMNPADAALLDLTKDAEGHYLKIELDGIMKQLTVYENTIVDAGYFLLLDTSKWTVKMLEDINVETGLNDEDFSKNMISVICEARLHSYMPSVYAGAVFYDDFATIIEALRTV